MSNTTKLEITSEQFPEGQLNWQIEFPDMGEELLPVSAELQFLYNNGLYDIVSIITARLGIEMSKLVVEILKNGIDGDNGCAIAEAKSVIDNLAAATAVTWGS